MQKGNPPGLRAYIEISSLSRESPALSSFAEFAKPTEAMGKGQFTGNVNWPFWVLEALLLFAGRFKAEVFAKEWDHMVLEAVGYRAGVGTLVDLKPVRDSV